MLSSINLSRFSQTTSYFWLFAIASLAICLLGVFLNSPAFLLIPFGLLFIAFAVANPKYLIYFFFAILPFSVEIEVGSLGTDLPSEPIMILMMGLCIVLLIVRANKIPKQYFLNPITGAIFLHIIWIGITSLTSTNQLYSFKYLLAKLWYVIPFFVLPLLVMKNEKDFRRIFSFLSFGMFIAIIYVLARHAAEGFSFASSNFVMRPIFRNHVNYAIMLLAFLPYYWYLLRSSTSNHKYMYYGLLLLLLSGIYFSYTRAAQMSVILAIGFYFVIKYKLLKLSMGAAIAGLVVFVMFMGTNNKYLDFAPDFSKTIAHKKFDNLVEATTKMEDISTVERFYRWVAGAYMVAEKQSWGLVLVPFTIPMMDIQ